MFKGSTSIGKEKNLESRRESTGKKKLIQKWRKVSIEKKRKGIVCLPKRAKTYPGRDADMEEGGKSERGNRSISKTKEVKKWARSRRRGEQRKYQPASMDL